MIGLFVRYVYIVAASLLSVVFRNKIGRNVGWMKRYLDLYRNVDEARKKQQRVIMVQVGLSFIGMYCFYAVMTYFLSSLFQMSMSTFDIIPSSNNYLSSLFQTTLLI